MYLNVYTQSRLSLIIVICFMNAIVVVVIIIISIGASTCTTLCLKKVPIFKLSVTLSNLNRFAKFYTAGKRMKFATKLYNITHLTLGTLLHYLGKLKIQIFCIYSADIEENANKLHFILSAPILILVRM